MICKYWSVQTSEVNRNLLDKYEIHVMDQIFSILISKTLINMFCEIQSLRRRLEEQCFNKMARSSISDFAALSLRLRCTCQRDREDCKYIVIAIDCKSKVSCHLKNIITYRNIISGQILLIN